jgi:hypothetical protein
MGLDEFGNTAIQPGPLLPAAGLDALVQEPKYWLSDYGLRYSLQQTITYSPSLGRRGLIHALDHSVAEEGCLLALIETAPEAPVLEVRLISEARELDYIELIRLGSGSRANRADETF